MSLRRRSSLFACGLAAATVVAAAVGAPSSAETNAELKPVGDRTAAQQREEPDPALVTAPAQRPSPAAKPADRYAMAGSCYAVRNSDGRVLTQTQDGYALTVGGDPTPLHFQATELGRYLLWDTNEKFVSRSPGTVAPAAEPSEDAEWTIDGSTDNFSIDEGLLGVTDGWRFELADGCPTWPEVELNVSGKPFAGTSPIQEVRGYIDDHIHQMATDFLGGGIHCGRPWHRYGVQYALRDCEDHIATGGKVALPEIVLSGVTDHDPTGWPTFEDWPAPGSLTHESVYYKWVERAWRGGQRMFVNLLVENEVLCTLYPNLSDPTANVPGVTKTCNDMDQVRHQARLIHEMQDYIDAQWGGPGKGWFRIVGTPEEARRVINAGKLAVVLGTETSDIFNCSKANAATELLDELAISTPLTCSPEDLDEGLDELHDLGVRQMVITHKFDNAFGGAKGDHGFNGIATNLGNMLMTGSFFDMEPCTDGFAPDNAQLGPDDAAAVPGLPDLIDLLGKVAVAIPVTSLPIYQAGDQCNQRGLTELGEQMIRKMVERGIMVDVDHFNSKTRSQVLDILEELHYSGTVSSHSWADDHAIPRVYQLGGFVSPYAGGSESFAGEWAKLTSVMDGRYFWGVGFGADMNGLGPQGQPRHPSDNPVTYPFTGYRGVEVDHQHSGERVYDINDDGVAHYGLYPDWWQDLKMIKGSDILRDMRRGSEAYLQTWERTNGATNDACREPDLRRPASDFAAIASGTSATDVLYAFGQPHVRAGQQYRYCALAGSDPATVTVTFDDDLAVAAVATSGDTDQDDTSGQSSPDGADQDEVGGGGADQDESDEDGAALAADSATSGFLPGAGGISALWLFAAFLALTAGATARFSTRRHPL